MTSVSILANCFSAAGLVRRRTCEPSLAHVSGAGQQRVLPVAQPLASQQALEQRLVEPARMAVVGVLGRRVGLELGALQALG
jgi:hypothetical protein